MGFDIQLRVVEDGEVDEGAFEAYAEALLDLFARSTEASKLSADGSGPHWAGVMLDYAAHYLGVTPASMTSADFREVLFELFPRKVSCPPSDAPEIVMELRAFWTFARREFGLPHADSCLRLLGPDASRQLERDLADSSRYGMAKSFVMQGMRRGFDVTSQEGLQAWMQTYNRELGILRADPPAPLPRARADDAKRRKRLRKMRKASRKQNR